MAFAQSHATSRCTMRRAAAQKHVWRLLLCWAASVLPPISTRCTVDSPFSLGWVTESTTRISLSSVNNNGESSSTCQQRAASTSSKTPSASLCHSRNSTGHGRQTQSSLEIDWHDWLAIDPHQFHSVSCTGFDLAPDFLFYFSLFSSFDYGRAACIYNFRRCFQIWSFRLTTMTLSFSFFGSFSFLILVLNRGFSPFLWTLHMFESVV